MRRGVWISLAVSPVILFSSIATGQMSIGSVQNYVTSKNLEAITLQGTVRLTPQGDRFNRCGSYIFTLHDDSGSIEIAVRRPARMISIQSGDFIKVHAQIQILSRASGQTPRICIQATDIIPLKK